MDPSYRKIYMSGTAVGVTSTFVPVPSTPAYYQHILSIKICLLPMAMASTSNTSWMDNVFYGWIDTTWDALLILEAARRGIVPRVTRRFHDIEKRNMIRSGAVIVFTEEESGIKRFTDPYVWSASRMLGNFMVRDIFHEWSSAMLT